MNKSLQTFYQGRLKKGPLSSPLTFPPEPYRVQVLLCCAVLGYGHRRQRAATCAVAGWGKRKEPWMRALEISEDQKQALP